MPRLPEIWPVGVPLNGILGQFNVSIIIGRLTQFLLQTDAPGSSCYSPNQSFVQGTLVPLRGQRYLEIKIWALCILIDRGISLIINHISRQNLGNVYVCLI